MIPPSGTRFVKFFKPAAIILLFTAATNLHLSAAVFTANGFQIKLNGTPFVIKGRNLFAGGDVVTKD